MNKDKLEQLCFLTDKQKRAFKSLKSAYEKCLNEKIYFHQVLETLSAYNGINVEDIDDNPDGGHSTMFFRPDAMKITCSWADDTHYIHLKSTSCAKEPPPEHSGNGTRTSKKETAVRDTDITYVGDSLFEVEES